MSVLIEFNRILFEVSIELQCCFYTSAEWSPLFFPTIAEKTDSILMEKDTELKIW